MTLDIYTLTIVLIVSFFLQAASLFGQFCVSKSRSGPGWWTVGSTLLAIGFAFHSVRNSSSISLFATVANTCMFFAGLVLFYVGVLRFFDRKERSGWLVSFGALFVCALTYFTYFSNALSMRRLIFSAAVATLSYLIAWSLYVYKNRSITKSANFLAAVFMANGCFFLLRGMTVLGGTATVGAYEPVLTQSVTYLITFVLSTLWTFGFIVLSNQWLNAESYEAKEHFELIFNSSPDAVLITRVSDGCFVDINDGFTALTGFTRAEVLGKSSLDMHLWTNPEDRRKMIAELNDHGFCENLEILLHHKDGRQLTGIVSAKIFLLLENPHILSVIRDISQRKQAEKALLESEFRWKFAIEGSGDGVWDWNIQSDEAKYSHRWKQMLGYADNDILPTNQEWVDRIHPDDRLFVADAMKAYLEGKTEMYSVEYRLKCKDDSYKWILGRGMVVSRNGNGEPLRMIGTHSDVTERKQVERALEESNRKLETLSMTDGLTGIANRRHFDEILFQEHGRHARSGAELSLIMLDIDYFKMFNDCYGHVAGDDCLRQIALVMSDSVARTADLVARYGGEEFVCVLPETDLAGACAIAEKIRAGILARAIPHKGSRVSEYVTASLGVISVRCTSDKSIEELLAQVDGLLYRAKSNGRNRVEFDESQLTDELGRINLLQLVWKDAFNCGNQLIDMQHQSLFHISNELLEAVLANAPITVTSSIVRRLLHAVTQHFCDEEKILETAGYTDLKRHAEEHATLNARGQELSRELEASTLSTGDVFQFLVHDVVMEHLLGTDRKYFPFISKTHI